MTSSNYDVVIIGGGCAGMTAALGLAKAGFAVAVVEAAPYPGAENWSGCVYFGENLADPAILGTEGLESLAWERRLVERGIFASDGQGLLGVTYRDPEAFRHCYTVLRPVYDHHLSLLAIKAGVVVLADTTAESLIRDAGRVVGVSTSRGPLYGDLVFLAEGDASHLVTREGYERFGDRREQPKFLQGIKQIIELPPGAVEEIFQLGEDEGAAYEVLLRNGTLKGKPVHLNMGGFVYTNKQSLSIGLVLPADNLRDHFGGDPNLLMEWFEELPVLKPWLKDGQRGAFGAKIIRGGGIKEVPRLIDEGLAIGGAASGIGIDFPYPNFTGPATAMGLLLVRAACKIREQQGRFTEAALRQHYLEPLQKTNYWQDVEFLRHWPAYVKRTTVFFDRNVDLALGSAYVWTRRDRWLPAKWHNWLKLLWQVAGPRHWPELRGDLRHLSRALHLRDVVGRPGVGRLLLDGTINAFRDLLGRPRAHLPPAGTVHLHYRVGEGTESSQPPWWVRRWFRRFGPVLAPAAKRVYANDGEPLEDKLVGAAGLLVRQVNMLDVLGAGVVGLAAAIGSLLLAGWQSLKRLLGWTADQGMYSRYAQSASQAADLTPRVAAAAQHWEGRLGHLAYQTVKDSHIQLLWPQDLAKKNAIVQDGLWNVCPAHVYEARVNDNGQLQVIVNHENCIKCETCWRTSDIVDWGRDGQHRFIYPVRTPAAVRVLAAAQAAGLAKPAQPHSHDWWSAAARDLADRLRQERPSLRNGAGGDDLIEVEALLDKLERKLEEFEHARAAEPRNIDRARSEHLEMLARYAQQLAAKVQEILRRSPLGDMTHASLRSAHDKLIELANTLAARTEEMVRYAWEQHYHWAAATGRQVRQHHLVGLRRFLQVLGKYVGGPRTLADPAQRWLQAEEDATEVADVRSDWSRRLDMGLPANLWRTLDRGESLSSEQDAFLRDLLAKVPPLDPSNLTVSLHPPLRKLLLAELGRRDPSLAYRAMAHLQARDLARLAASGASPLTQAFQRWARGDEWACFAAVDAVPTSAGGWQGEALFVPVRHARSLLLLVGDQLAVIADPQRQQGLAIETVPTLGLRGAGIARIRLDGFVMPGDRVTVDADRLRRAWSVLSAADLTSTAAGLAELLCRRATAHAASRVQFPGLFWDEQARDPIGKFGAVKKMLADMGARRYLIETLDHVLSPADFSTTSVNQAGLLKHVVAQALGTSPGSLTYNAGQIFGGTGYSEDDILAKAYRDAAAWRFLEPSLELARRHGAELLRGWRSDGQGLAALPGEADNFEQLAQRKALQEELDKLRVCRSQLRALVNEWDAAGDFVPSAATTLTLSPKSQAEIGEGLARQDALLLASKALLLRTHARLEKGLPAEAETTLLRVWLQEVSRSLEEFEGTVRRHFRRSSKAEGSSEPMAALPSRYRDYLAAAAPYDSGDFLRRPADSGQPRYVPELVEADPELSAKNRELQELVAGHFGPPRGDGLSFERFIEQQHRPSPEDLDFCRRHDFFRMMIPKELGGAGRSKAEYYLLTTNTQRLADIAITLTIQVNTSIGTTPVLLGRDKELPRSQKELTAFLGDPAYRDEAQALLDDLLARLPQRDFADLHRSYDQLHSRLEATILTSNALKALFHHFLESWQAAGRAGKAFDRTGVQTHLEEARRHWQASCSRAEEYQQELGRRRQACDLFLRWVASGQISAFALTEPSAGSDTARVATRARLRSVPVLCESDGILTFVPTSAASQKRILLDARRLEFKADPSVASGQRAFYRWSDSAEPAPILFDEYDYETDDPKRQRYYLQGGRKAYFSDIAQLRERDGQYWYDYWELTGAKMWITNGRMCGIMSLYAKTDEGITGFIVDRHADGLIVGRDEEKLGQCGSPTNELSLQAVRVPSENVIGIEGRGQVNALETLNVGRAGLPMAALAQMQGLIEQSRTFVLARHGEVPDWASWRLDRMEEEQFWSGALVYEMVGRSEHPQTKSVRMESAIAKMLVTEALHRVIELAEEMHGLAGQTQLHLVEKRKRDARVLNIYEGTNEVQRFLVLKELAESRKPKDESPLTGQPSSELDMLRLALVQRVEAARAVFGAQLWQNPNLQANCFLLAEAAAWYKAADSAAGRLAWIRSQVSRDPAGERGDSSPLVDIGQNALARCVLEARQRLRRFDEELSQLRRGFYAPEVRAACLMMDRLEEGAPAVLPASRINRPLAILVVVEPALANLPVPQVREGKLLEPYWTLSDADRSALEMALRLRDASDAPVSIQVAAVGPRSAAPALREALALGIDRVRQIIPESEAVSADSAAAAIATLYHAGPRFDLVLGGGGTAVSEEGMVARLTAEALGIRHAGLAGRLAIRAGGSEGEAKLVTAEGRARTVALPTAVTLLAGLALRSYTIESYLAGLARAVEAERWPKKLEARPVVYAEATRLADGPSDAAPGPLSPRDAAGRVLVELGMRGAAAAPKPFEGNLEEVASPTALAGASVAIIAADLEGRLDATAGSTIQAAKLLADLEGIGVVVWLLVPPQGAAEPRALAQLRVLYRGDTVVMPLEGATDLRGQLLHECWQAAALPIKIAVGEPWTAPVFEAIGGRLLPAAVVASGVRQLDFLGDHAMLATNRQRGKVRARQIIAAGANVPCFVSLAGEIQLSDNRSVVVGRLKPFKAGELHEGRVWRWTPKLERFYGRDDIQRLLNEVRAETGLARLADADFIIDVGFGVGNRDGYEAVIEPLQQALQELGVRNLAIGGSRKVTEELKLLPADRQIGQSGVSVQPRILLAIGISGAPQHLDYIGGQAVILAFNRDADAPLMTLGKRKPRPKVFPVLGDLFETVPALVAALRQEQAVEAGSH